MKFLILFILVCVVVSAVFLFPRQGNLPDGSIYVFSLKLYFDRLLNFDFPDYSYGSVIGSIGPEDTDNLVSFDFLVSAIDGVSSTKIWPFSIFFKDKFENRLRASAQSAVNGSYNVDYVSYDGVVYSPYDSPNSEDHYLSDVMFYVSDYDGGSFLDQLSYLISYIGQSFVSILKNAKYLLPYNCYEVLVYSR